MKWSDVKNKGLDGGEYGGVSTCFEGMLDLLENIQLKDLKDFDLEEKNKNGEGEAIKSCLNTLDTGSLTGSQIAIESLMGIGDAMRGAAEGEDVNCLEHEGDYRALLGRLGMAVDFFAMLAWKCQRINQHTEELWKEYDQQKDSGGLVTSCVDSVGSLNEKEPWFSG